MKERIKLLPLWCITNKYPAFYDTDSATAIEQTAKLYAAMRELQEDYNKYVTEVNSTITEFINDSNADQQAFENKITQSIEKLKEAMQKAIDYMQANIKETTTEVANELLQRGQIELQHTYLESIKKLILMIPNDGYAYDEGNKQLNLILRVEG